MLRLPRERQQGAEKKEYVQLVTLAVGVNPRLSTNPPTQETSDAASKGQPYSWLSQINTYVKTCVCKVPSILRMDFSLAFDDERSC